MTLARRWCTRRGCCTRSPPTIDCGLVASVAILASADVLAGIDKGGAPVVYQRSWALTKSQFTSFQNACR